MGKQAKAKAARRDGNALWNELRRQGVTSRVAAAHAALNSAAFQHRFQAEALLVAGTERDPKGPNDVFALAKPILVSMGVDLADVVIGVEFQPRDRRIAWKCRLDPAAVRRVLDQLGRKSAA